MRWTSSASNASRQMSDVDRQADAEIRAHGRIHRDQPELQRIVEVGRESHRPVEDRLAVFVLADLEEGRLLPALDEVAGGVDHEEPHRPVLDLPAEQHRDVEGELGLLQGLARRSRGRADRAADQLGGAEHGRAPAGASRARRSPGSRCPRARAHDRLRDRQIAGRRERQDPFPGLVEDMQLAEGRDVVEPGIGARVGDHHEALLDEDSGAIGHRLLSAAARSHEAADASNRPRAWSCRTAQSCA